MSRDAMRDLMNLHFDKQDATERGDEARLAVCRLFEDDILRRAGVQPVQIELSQPRGEDR